MFRRFFIKKAQQARLAMYDESERQAVENLRAGNWNIEGLGAGVSHALNETNRHTGQWTVREINDPFRMTSEMAWRCEEAAIQSAALGKQLGQMGRVVGGHLVAAIFGLRVIAESTTDPILADKARQSLARKLDLARRALIAYRAEVEGMSRAEHEKARYIGDGGDDVRDFENPFR